MPGLGTGDAHVLVTLYADDHARLDQARARLQETLDAAGEALAVVHEQLSESLDEGRDHFGFKDGIAQPALAGSGAEPRPGDGMLNGHGGWRALAPGEFVLGYPDEDGGLPLCPAPPFDRNSTYVVYRKMQMHPERMRSYLRNAPGDPDVLAAKLVGRWQDGTPLITSPERPGPVDRQRSGARERLPLPRGPGRARVSRRRARPSRQPARRRRLLRRQAVGPPPHHPARPGLRAGAAGRRRSRTTGWTAGWCSSATRRTSSGSSR